MQGYTQLYLFIVDHIYPCLAMLDHAFILSYWAILLAILGNTYTILPYIFLFLETLLYLAILGFGHSLSYSAIFFHATHTQSYSAILDHVWPYLAIFGNARTYLFNTKSYFIILDHT